MKVTSTLRPQSIETTEYDVYENTNIEELIETDNGREVKMYQYNQQKYNKNEYIISLHTQLTNTQLALVEIFEMQLKGDITE